MSDNEIDDFLERYAQVDRTKTWQLYDRLKEAVAIIRRLDTNHRETR